MLWSMFNSEASAVTAKQVVVVVVVGRQEMNFLKSNNCRSRIEHVTPP
jgi:hypothetical protein